jgi:ribosomal protein L37AE/L43A
MAFKFLICAAVEDKGRPCPRCNSTNTDKQGNIWYCYDCQKEF